MLHIEFDPKRETARVLKSELVKSYMRVAFAVSGTSRVHAHRVPLGTLSSRSSSKSVEID